LVLFFKKELLPYLLLDIRIMPTLNVVTRTGETKQFEAKIGSTVMESIVANGIDEVLALCGGCCSCATCHVYVDPAFAEKLTPMSEAENDLLDGSSHRKPNSRLSCQIAVSPAIEGLLVTVAPED
jgi:2Fe-2S ferredoxin